MRFQVLLIEDNSTDALLIQEMLESVNGTTNFDIFHVERLSHGLAQLERRPFDLVLLDLSLPDSQGPDTFERLHTHASQIPIIVLTGLDDRETAVQAVQRGAQDYLVKGSVDEHLLQRAMRYAIERKRTEEALRRRTAQLEALHDIALEITSQLNLDRLLHSITSRAIELVGGTAGLLGLYQAETDQIEFITYIGIEHPSTPLRFRRGEGLTGQVLESGQPVFVENYITWPHRSPTLEPYVGDAAIMGIPVHWGDQILGVLEIIDPSSRTFGQADAELLHAFSTQAAIAIRNARLQEKLREHADQLEQLVAARTAELRSERAQLEAILQSITDGIFVVDAEGDIIHTNVVARTWLNQTLTPEDSEKLRTTVQKMAACADAKPERLLSLRGLDLEVQAAPITTEHNQTTAVVVVHDVTHLRALNRMKSKFVSNISHEMRTPLTTIKLYTQMIMQQPKRSRDYAIHIEREVNRQIEMVEQILQISRLDTGRLEINPLPTDINDLGQIAVGNHGALADGKGIHLTYRPHPEPLPAFLDPRQAIVALNNLLRNAVQYTGAGGTVTVSTRVQETQERQWATISVQDTGMGIPEEEISHIFERFYRGERARLLQVSGNGLGLAIVKEIVELHGGRVTVRSRVGEGSVFTLWFPLGQSEAAEG
ncbi:MAG: ATP-binding protein [Anaerolineae bacterium]